MMLRARFVVSFLIAMSYPVLAQAPTSNARAGTASVPRLIRYSGAAKDESRKPMSGTVGITFTLYKEQQDSVALWMETQNVVLDDSGHYSVQLGSTDPNGIPAELFASGDAKWLGVRVEGQVEQPRILLLSVPYALKAGDAETLGGLPASAFVSATTTRGSSKSASSTPVVPASTAPRGNTPAANVTGAGTANFIPLWTSSSNIGNSKLFQSTAGNIGLGTSAPAAKLDVIGAPFTVRGISSAATGRGLFGGATSTTGVNFGVYGQTNSTSRGSAGVTGVSSATSGFAVGILGRTASPNGAGVLATNTAPGGTGIIGQALDTSTVVSIGIQGTSSSGEGTGVVGNGAQWGVYGTASNGVVSALGYVPAGVYGEGTGTTSATYGVEGVSRSPTGSGVFGNATSASGTTNGVLGLAASTTMNAAGVTGVELATVGQVYGVAGTSNSSTTYTAGVFGAAASNTGLVYGVTGVTSSSTNGASAVNGYEGASTGQVFGVNGVTNSTTTYSAGVAGGTVATTGVIFGVNGATNSRTDGAAGVNGYEGSITGTVYGVNGVTNSKSGAGVNAVNLANGGTVELAGDLMINAHTAGDVGQFNVDYQGNGFFNGSLIVNGALFAGTKDFRIDHPLDPANKYLLHAAVESSEMMNIYTGNVKTDAQGEGSVRLPEWFEALNTDFRYQLTVIGDFAQAMIAQKIANNRFLIRASKPNVEVSWQVTGVRQDAFAKANPLVVEQQKPIF